MVLEPLQKLHILPKNFTVMKQKAFPNILHNSQVYSKLFLGLAKQTPEAVSSHSKETGLVIYLAFLAKVANLQYTILTAFKKYWPDIVAKFMSGTQETFI